LIIGACGYGYTGSSAVMNLLQEFDDIQVFNNCEFTYAYRVDGLQDIEYHVMKNPVRNQSGDAAIRRFLYSSQSVRTPIVKHPLKSKESLKITKKYINSLIQAKYRGIEYVDIRSGNIFKNIFNLGVKHFILRVMFKMNLYNSWFCKDLYVCIEPDNFYDKSKQYIRDILLSMGADLNKTVVLDQPFQANAPEKCFHFFDNPKAIVVDRDPRDLFILARYVTHRSCFMPRHCVKEFVEYFRNMRKSQKRESTDRVLFLQFEDLIYEYKKSIDAIKKFTGHSNHIAKYNYFNPNASISNTQLYKKYTKDYSNIRYIEEQLQDYLFPFENYPEAEVLGKPFDKR